MVYEEAGRGQKTAQQPDGHEGKAPPVLAPEPQNSIIVSDSSFGLATYAGETSAGALGKLATSCQEESGGDGGSSMAPTVQILTTATAATSAPAAASATPLSAREEFVIVPASSAISVPADEVRCCALWGRPVVDASRLRAWDSQHTLVRWREPVASADFVLKTWGVHPTRPAVMCVWLLFFSSRHCFCRLPHTGPHPPLRLTRPNRGHIPQHSIPFPSPVDESIAKSCNLAPTALLYVFCVLSLGI